MATGMRKRAPRRAPAPKGQKKALIRLRSKPKRPKRRQIKEEVEIFDGNRLDSLLGQIGYQGNDSEGIYFRKEYGFDEDCETFLCFDRMQTDEEHEENLAHYRERLNAYHEWYKRNEETILDEITRRKEEAEKQERQEIEKAQADLQKRLSKIPRRNE